MTTTVAPVDRYMAEFERVAPGLPGLTELRRDAIGRFAALGFPTTRDEDWRFTDATPLAEIPFRPATGTSNLNPLAAVAQGPLKACQIAFVDGRYAPAFSSRNLPQGVMAGSLARFLLEEPDLVGRGLARTAAYDRRPFAALNTAFVQDGAFLQVGPGVELDTPIHVLFMSSHHGQPYVTHPRVLCTLEKGARAVILESYLGPAGGTYFTNAVTEIVLHEDARLHHTKLQRESRQAYHVAATQAVIGRNASFTSLSITLGAALSRNDLGARLEGQGAECTLNGLYEVTGSQLADNHTVIEHAHPHGTSRELYKGILDGTGQAVFDGRILVRPDAQKTDAVQSNRNLLLSKTAMVHTKPQLEIFADDVRCKHGATIGQLDRDMLFYLRARGIGPEEARRLLIHAFAGEILDQAPDAIRPQLGGCLLLLEPGEGGGHP